MSSKSNLIVNYIPNEISDVNFREMFVQFGNMTNCKLIKDKSTNMSVGYGFVKYDTDESANAAIMALNGKTIGNKRMKVSIARPEGSPIAAVDKAVIFVGGLPKAHSQANVQAMFAPFGGVEEVKVFIDMATGQSRGSAFVKMDSPASAQSAIASMNGQSIEGSVLTVKEFTSRSKNPPNYGQPGYLGSPPYGVSQAFGVNAYTSQYLGQGLSQGLSQGLGPDYQGSSYQYGVGSYQGSPSLSGYAQLYGSNASYGPGYDGPGFFGSNYAPPRSPTFGRGRSRKEEAARGDDGPNATLFVFHLPIDVQEDRLHQLFTPFGTVQDASVSRNKEDNSSRGFGFVSFSTIEEAHAALLSMNGYQIGNKYLKVSFKK